MIKRNKSTSIIVLNLIDLNNYCKLICYSLHKVSINITVSSDCPYTLYLGVG